jgi:transcriptional regulator with XRE-family HTH domain
MNPPPWPPPEAALIRIAREARGLSHAEASERITIQMGGRRWRQIEDGYESTKSGKRASAGDMQLAHMASVVGVTPDELEEVGRGGAAQVLRRILLEDAQEDPYALRDGETENERMDRLYQEWKQRPDDRRTLLRILESKDDRTDTA